MSVLEEEEVTSKEDWLFIIINIILF